MDPSSCRGDKHVRAKCLPRRRRVLRIDATAAPLSPQNRKYAAWRGAASGSRRWGRASAGARVSERGAQPAEIERQRNTIVVLRADPTKVGVLQRDRHRLAIEHGAARPASMPELALGGDLRASFTPAWPAPQSPTLHLLGRSTCLTWTCVTLMPHGSVCLSMIVWSRAFSFSAAPTDRRAPPHRARIASSSGRRSANQFSTSMIPVALGTRSEPVHLQRHVVARDDVLGNVHVTTRRPYDLVDGPEDEDGPGLSPFQHTAQATRRLVRSPQDIQTVEEPDPEHQKNDCRNRRRVHAASEGTLHPRDHQRAIVQGPDTASSSST